MLVLVLCRPVQLARLRTDKQAISVGFVGYPNVGKSSVINTLRTKKVRHRCHCRVYCEGVLGAPKLFSDVTKSKVAPVSVLRAVEYTHHPCERSQHLKMVVLAPCKPSLLRARDLVLASGGPFFARAPVLESLVGIGVCLAFALTPCTHVLRAFRT